MKTKETKEFEREIQEAIKRPHKSSRLMLKVVYALSLTGFLAGLYLSVSRPRPIEGLLLSAVSVLLYSRMIMGYRYWLLVAWIRHNSPSPKNTVASKNSSDVE